MKHATSEPAGRSVVPAIVLLICVAAYMADGYLTLDPASRNVPLLAGAVTIGLLLAELLRAGLTRRHTASPILAASRRDRGIVAARGKEWQVLLSVAAVIGGIYLLGFHIAIPAYLVIAIRLIGRRSWRTAALTAILATAAIHGAFEQLLAYRLFPGVLFS